MWHGLVKQNTGKWMIVPYDLLIDNVPYKRGEYILMKIFIAYKYPFRAKKNDEFNQQDITNKKHKNVYSTAEKRKT